MDSSQPPAKKPAPPVSPSSPSPRQPGPPGNANRSAPGKPGNRPQGRPGNRRPEPRRGGQPSSSRPAAQPQRTVEMPPLLAEVIAAAKMVSESLGGPVPHHFYRTALIQVLQKTHPELKQKLVGTLKHRDHKAAELQADFSLGGELLVNIHSREGGFSEMDLGRMSSALKFFHHRHGLVLGFGGPEVLVAKVSEPHDPFPALTQDEVLREAPLDLGDRNNATLFVRSLLRVARAHQLGYDASVWRGLIQTELTAENLSWTEAKAVPLHFQGQVLGNLSAPGMLHFQQRGLIYVTALNDRWQQRDMTNLKHYLHEMKCPWALLLHFGRRRLEWKWLGGIAGTVAKAT